MGPYTIKEVVSTNTVKLQLPTLMRIYLIVNVSQIVWYREQVEEQRKEKGKLVEVEGIKEQEVEKILNKRKIQEVDKYLAQWKEFTAESDTQEKEADLENAKELVDEFEGRLGAEVRRQEEVKERRRTKSKFRVEDHRRKLLGRYTVKLLYGWDDRKFKEEYLRKLETNQRK